MGEGGIGGWGLGAGKRRHRIRGEEHTHSRKIRGKHRE